MAERTQEAWIGLRNAFTSMSSRLEGIEERCRFAALVLEQDHSTIAAAFREIAEEARTARPARVEFPGSQGDPSG